MAAEILLVFYSPLSSSFISAEAYILDIICPTFPHKLNSFFMIRLLTRCLILIPSLYSDGVMLLL